MPHTSKSGFIYPQILLKSHNFNGGTGTGNFVFTVNAIDDALVEGTETIIATLTNPFNANGLATLGTASTITNITENDPDNATLSVTTHGDEGGPVDIVYTVTLDKQNDTGAAITFDISDTGAGTATSGADYVAIPGSAQISVADGASTGTYTVTVSQDLLLEATEMVQAQISNPSNAAVTITGSTATANIVDDETANAVLSVTTQGDETGPQSIVYTVTLSRQNDTGAAITFDVAFTGGNAVAGSDYTDTSGVGVISVAAGASTGTLVVPVLDDADLEALETLEATLSNPSNGAVSVTGPTANITDNDNANAVLSVTTQGDETGPQNIVYTVTLDKQNDTGAAITFDVAFTGGDAVAGSDYTDTSGVGVISVAAGATTVTLVVPVLDDPDLEALETLQATLSNPSNGAVTVTGATATANITDNDSANAVLSVTTQGDESGPVDILYTVTLSQQNHTGAAITFDLAFTDGNAVAGSDYTDTSGVGVISVAAGATTGTLVVPVLDDATLEALETLEATLSNPSNGAVTVTGPTATANITDDDTAQVTVAATTPASEPGTNGQFTISLTSPSSTDTVLSYSVGGTAASGVDYTALSGTVTIVADATTATIDVTVLDDLVDEPLETVVVTLTAITSGDADVSIGAANSATVNLTDDDNTPVVTAGQVFTVNETDGVGTSLGLVAATDADAPTTFQSWTIVSGNIDGIFAIDPATGELTVVDTTNLDFETLPTSYALGITVSDGTNTAAVETVTVNVIDVPAVITPGQVFAITENSPNATPVGTITGTGDAPVSLAIIAGNTGSAFAIDNVGNITVNNSTVLDFETIPVFTLTVEAFDGTTFTTELVTVNLTDVSNTLIVTTETDNLTVDADVSSIEALNVNMGADGKISLREAILATNNTLLPGADLISFDIFGAWPHTIVLAGALPTITDDVIIDGTTEPDFASAPMIEIYGSLTTGVDGLVLGVGSDSSTIRGLVINSFDGDNIRVASSGNTIAGNWIGLDVDGDTVMANGAHGIRLLAGASLNTIGGVGFGDRNVISGNLDGIHIDGNDNRVVGNYIGTDATGMLDRGNADDGVAVHDASSNIIGGTTLAERNIISGNDSDGVSITGVSSDNLVQGNFIGLDATGLGKIANADDGVDITNGSGNLVGGSTPGAGNVISGNDSDGVKIEGALATGNQILGNLIGTDATGLVGLGNLGDGVKIELGASGNFVGGPGINERNVISGNYGLDSDGIEIRGITTTGNIVRGNYIGVDINGTAPLANSDDGIAIENSPDNIIGGPGANEGNVLSGNADDGISISGVGSTGNIVRGNLIGTNAAGTAALGNLDDGLTIGGGASGNIIGGTGANEGNVLSGNADEGVAISDSDGNLLQGNTIGLDINGTDIIANGDNGIYITDSSFNTIGGGVPGAGNVISGNAVDGVVISGVGSTDNVVQGNFIGTDATGTAAKGNTGDGVRIRSGASNNFIGGTVAGEGNVISGNTSDGVYISSSNSNFVQGNYIGLDTTGLAALGNGDDGVQISDGADNVVGGTVPGARNVISGNADEGVDISGALATGNKVQGNYIGTDVTGAMIAGGGNRAGVEIRADASNNLIGGTVAGASNLIAYSTTVGVSVVGGVDNAILGNVIHSNADLGIDLNADDVTANDPGDVDVGPNELQNFPSLFSANTNGFDNITVIGTLKSTPGITTYRIEFFANIVGDPLAHGEAERFLGSTTVTTNALGDAFFSTSIPALVGVGELVTATATVDLGGGNYGSTSEFATNVVAVLNSVPVATDNANAVTEDIALVANGNMLADDDGFGVDTDADVADILTVSDINGVTDPAIDVAGIYGDLDWAADGSYTYALNNTQAAVQALNFGDALVDTFVYTVFDGNGGIDFATLTITIDGRDDVIFDINSTATVSEAGPTTATFTINVGGVISTGNTASVTVTGGGTAADGTDYILDFLTALGDAATATTGVGLVGNVLTFDDNFVGPTFAFSVDAQDDSLVEPTETITATLSGPTSPNGAATIVTALTSTDITDNDQDVTFALSRDVASIGEEAGGTVNFTITLSQAVNAGNSVSVDIADVVAGAETSSDTTLALQAAIDAALPGGVTRLGNTLTFDSTFVGTTFGFGLTAQDDALIEGTEALALTLTNATNANGTTGITTATASTNITEIDQDVTFALSRDVASISEDTGGTVTFTITLSQAVNAGNSVSIDIADLAGGAETSSDTTLALQAAIDAALPGGVTRLGNTLTFDDTFVGTTFGFGLTAQDDALIEGTEALALTLTNATNANGTTGITTATASTDITEVDQDVTFALTRDVASIGEEAGGTVNFTITLSQAINAGNSVSVDIADVAGGAETSSDTTQTLQAAIDAALPAGVTRLGNTLTFDDTFVGTTFGFGLTAQDDALIEGTEALALQLTNATNANGTTGITTATASTDITEIDQDLTFALSRDVAGINEQSGSTVTFTVTLSQALNPGNSVSVDITELAGGADTATDTTQTLQAAIDAALPGGVTRIGNTLTFDDTFVGTTLSFGLTGW